MAIRAQDAGDHTLDAVCAAVAAETGIPAGRVKKVLVAAQRHQHLQAGASTPPQAAAPAPSDPLRFYPLGANGRLHPPRPSQPADAETPT
jgi:hypothetical protein